MIRPFTHQALATRVVFGPGPLAQLPDDDEALGLTRVLVLCSPEQEDTGRRVVAWAGEGPTALAAVETPAGNE